MVCCGFQAAPNLSCRPHCNSAVKVSLLPVSVVPASLSLLNLYECNKIKRIKRTGTNHQGKNMSRAKKIIQFSRVSDRAHGQMGS